MSSRHRERSSRGSSSGKGAYPSSWSAWEWNDSYRCEVRYRLKSAGDYEYEYRPVQAVNVPRTSTTNLDPIAEPYSTHDHYTATANDTIQYTPAQTDPTGSITEDLERISFNPIATQQTAIAGSQPPPQPRAQGSYITTRDETTTAEEFDPHYKVHGAWEFEWGKVFKVLWAEPAGNVGGGQSVTDSQYSFRKGKFGETFSQKVRRFVVIDKRQGHCICLPIMTYSGQGVNKKGVKAEDHTIIYTDRPIRRSGEKDKGLTRKAIRVKPAGSRHKLDEASRLNYAKLYTVEYNVKVWFIGKIHEDSEWQLSADYNQVHPPMPARGTRPVETPDYVYEYTGGGTGGVGSYQANYSHTQPSSGYQQGTTMYAAPNYATTTTPYSDAQVASYPATSSHSYVSSVPAVGTYYNSVQEEDQPSSAYDREPLYD